MKLKKETLRWPHSQDEIISGCVHVLGFVYGKQEEMPARVIVPSSSARPVAIEHEEPQACERTHGVLQEDSSENDEVLKTIYFSMWKIFRTAPNMHSIS